MRRSFYVSLLVLLGCLSSTTYAFAEDKYSGEKKDGVPHGQGTKYFSDGSTYIGHFKNGEMSGSGTLTMTDGRIFSGEFENGVFGAKKSGKIRYLDGSYEEGIFDNWKLNGEGTQSMISGEVKKGTFKNGVLNGRGEVRWQSGQNYSGEFKDGVFHGKGRYIELDASYHEIISEGDFREGLMHGHGKRILPNTYTYEGEFKNNKFDGEGKLSYSDGVVAEGEFKNGMMNGLVVYSSPSGKFVFTGKFVDGETLEDGVFILDSKDKMVTVAGRLNNGRAKVNYPIEAIVAYKDNSKAFVGVIDKFHELIDGKLVYHNGEYEYNGKFKNSKPTVDGTLTAGNLTYVGEYDNALVPSGKGKITYENGDTYVGKVQNLKPFGEGKYSFSTSEYIEGKFNDADITNCTYVNPNQTLMSEKCNTSKVFNGKSAIFSSNQEFYIGELKDSERIGKSYLRLNYSPTKYYVGYAENNVPSGFGKLYTADNFFVEGEYNTIDTVYKKREFRLIYSDADKKVYYNKSGVRMVETLTIFNVKNPSESWSRETYSRYQSKCDDSFLLAQERNRTTQWQTKKVQLKPDNQLNTALYKVLCK